MSDEVKLEELVNDDPPMRFGQKAPKKKEASMSTFFVDFRKENPGMIDREGAAKLREWVDEG